MPALPAVAQMPGVQLARPYRASQMRPARVAQFAAAEPTRSMVHGGPAPMMHEGPQSVPGPMHSPDANPSGGYIAGDHFGAHGGGACSNGYYCGDSCDVYCGDGYGGGCYDGGCGCDCGDCGCGCCAAACQPQLRFYVDWLNLQASDADIAHAQQQDGLGGAGTVPFGQIGTVDTQYDGGIRIGGDIACGPCAGVTMSYTFFETGGLDSIEPPAIPGGGGAVGSLVHHPNATVTASAGPVDASYEVNYQLADILYRSSYATGPCFNGNYLLGVQYGNLEQEFGQSGVFGGGQGGTIDTISTVDFDGAGLKAGLDGERRLRGGFSVYGRLTGAVMTGRFSSRYTMFNSTTDVLLARAVWKDDRIVPQLEYEVGLGWTSPSDRWRLAAGYMYSHWMNTVTVGEFIDSVQADNYVDIEDTLSFDGFVTRVECRY